MVFDLKFCIEAFGALWKAVPLTLFITFWSFVLALILGLIFAIIRYKNVKGFDWFAKFYISFVRGTPIMLQLYMIYYILPYLIKVTLALFGVDFEIAKLSPRLLVIWTVRPILAIRPAAGICTSTRPAGICAL